MDRLEAVIGAMKMGRELTIPEAREAERRRIRRAIAPHLLTLKGVCVAFGGDRGECSCSVCVASAAIDAATKAPRKAKVKR